MWSLLLPPLLPLPPSPTPPTLTPTAPTPTWPLVLPLLPSPTPPTPMPTMAMLDTPTPWLPTTPGVSTTLAALCLAHKPTLAAFRLRPKDRRRTAKDRGRLENEN